MLVSSRAELDLCGFVCGCAMQFVTCSSCDDADARPMMMHIWWHDGAAVIAAFLLTGSWAVIAQCRMLQLS